jgi:WD40 repeat protein
MDDLLAMGDQDGVITLWDINTGDIVRTFGSHAGLIFRLEFSRDGTRLASASFDRLAKIWDVTTGEEVARLFGNTGSVFGVSFSPDGDHLATAGADGTIRTYTLRTDELINLALSRVSRTLTEVECQLFLHEESCAQYSVRMKIHRAK